VPNYMATGSGDNEADLPKRAPEQWNLVDRFEGMGLCEYQGYAAWTKQEKEEWCRGELQGKWGILQVTVRSPIPDFVSFMAILYGFLPFLVPIWFLISIVVDKCKTGSFHVFPYFGLCICLGFAVINELVTKAVCKRAMSRAATDRPPEAVCKKAGMPSGHVMNAYTLMAWTILEAFTDKIIYPEWLIIILFINLPVPWARVYNCDHTWQQVGASAFIASFMGFFAYSLRKAHYPNVTEPWQWNPLPASLLSRPFHS